MEKGLLWPKGDTARWDDHYAFFARTLGPVEEAGVGEDNVHLFTPMMSRARAPESVLQCLGVRHATQPLARLFERQARQKAIERDEFARPHQGDARRPAFREQASFESAPKGSAVLVGH